MVERGRFRGGVGGATGKRKRDVGFAHGSYQKHQKFDNGKARNQLRHLSKPTAEANLPSANVEQSGSEEDDEALLDDNVTAYSVLLQSLQANGGPFADAYAQRQREEHGASSSDEEDQVVELGVDGINDEDDVERADLQSDSVQLLTVAGEDTEKEDRSRFKDEVEEDDVDGQVHSRSEDESGEDVSEIRVASGVHAGIGLDPFKNHVEQRLTDDEIAKLVQGKEKFNCKVAAAGVRRGNWVFNTSSAPKDEKSLLAYTVKKRLQDSWKGMYGKPTWGDFESEQQCQFFSLCNSYQDILHTRKLAYKSDGQGDQEDSSTMDAYVFHILNHIVKTRDVITKNNEKLLHPTSDSTISDPPRDQGFTRPKVLVLLPFRSSALQFVDRLLKLAPSLQKTNVEHKGRFFDEFGVEEDNAVEPEKETPGQKERKSAKPADFLSLFSGNNDDHFRIGIKFTRKSIKLYSEFYSSDIIIASPVGLITRIGEAEMEKAKDVDFLSSVEIAVIDYTDVILMQNWSHVVSIFDHLNRIPAQQHGTDFMRIREWYLNGHARHYRQTIILSSFADAGVNALFHRACVNHAGKVKAQCKYEGSLSKIVLQVRQVYEKFDCREITDVDDSRFEFFVKQVFPKIKNSFQDGTMIFTRSYFDFVRLRNFLKSESASFCLLGEYTKQSDVSRARSWFFHGERKILLYSERAQFFHRYKVRGIKDLIFYSLPDHAHFYVELLNLLEGKENPSCTVLFSRFDNLQLERIVGTSRSKRMLTSSNKLFMFC